MEHPGYLHEIAISPQTFERRPHSALVLVDFHLWPAFELHGLGISGYPHCWLLQAGLDYIGGHGGIHHQTGPQTRLQPAGLAADNAAQRDPKGAGTLQVQTPGQDAV